MKRTIEILLRLVAPPARTVALFLAAGAAGGAWASTKMTNPVTGQEETYANTFTGGTSSEWDEASNWDTSVKPFVTGNYEASLVDGKTASTSTAVDGWTLRVGAYNGASVSWNGGITKIQAGTAGCWLTADGSSSITIASFGEKQLEGSSTYPLKLSSAKAGGITWNCGLTATSSGSDKLIPFHYYIDAIHDGTVVYTGNITVGNAQVIKQVNVKLTGNSQVSSKTLVTFGSGTTKAFTADAAIKFYDADGTTLKKLVGVTAVRQPGATIANTSSVLTTANAVGTCELVQCTDGIVLYYVDGDPSEVTGYTPSININFCFGNAPLTTAAAVGYSDYAVPGTSWNNMTSTSPASGNGTFTTPLTTVYAVKADGTTSLVSGASVALSGTPGSYKCSSLAAATDLRHGYIDENANNTAPTVTVSGIPYDQYKVVVYTSTDTADMAFGYVSVNGTNYTYVDNKLAIGTTSWGNSGASNSAKAIAEGVNMLVTPAISGATTATIVGHKSNGRGCIAAIQIVDATPNATTGTYTFSPAADTTTAITSSSNWDNLPTGKGEDITISISGDATVNVDRGMAFGTITIASTSESAATLTFTGSYVINATQINVPANVTVKVDSAVSGTPVLNAPVVLSDAATLEIAAPATISKTISGSGGVVVSANAVVFTVKNTFTGGLTVKSGGLAKTTVTATTGGGFGGTGTNPQVGTITVENGGTVDVANCYGKCVYSLTIEGDGVDNQGAVICSSVIGETERQITGITLTGNASISCANNWGLIASEYTATTLSLGSYTLEKKGSAAFWLTRTTVSGTGTLDIKEGILATGGSTSGTYNTRGNWTYTSNSFAPIVIRNGAALTVNNASLRANSLTLDSGSSMSVGDGAYALVNNSGTLTANGSVSVAGTLFIGWSSNASFVVGSDVEVTGTGLIHLMSTATITKQGSGGTITIGPNAMVRWIDCSWTNENAGDIFRGDGTLSLEGTGRNCSYYPDPCAFPGTLKVVTRNGTSDYRAYYAYFSGDPSKFTARPKLLLACGTEAAPGSVQLGNPALGKTMSVRDLNGHAVIYPWASNSGTFTIDTLQRSDTSFNGIFVQYAADQGISALTVRGETEATQTHSLTLTKASTTTGAATVRDNAKLIFASSGSWANGTVAVANGGYLEVNNSDSVASTLELQSGGTIKIATATQTVNDEDVTTAVGITAGTVKFPDSGMAVIDVSAIPDLSEDDEVTIITATTLDTDIANLRLAGKPYSLKVDGNSLKVVNDGGLVWDSTNGWGTKDVTQYGEATITSPGTVALGGTSLSFDTLTLTGSGTVSFSQTGDETITVNNIVIGSGVTLDASAALSIAGGATITGAGTLNIPNGVTLTLDGVTCSAKITAQNGGTLVTKGTTTLSNTNNNFAYGSLINVATGKATVNAYKGSGYTTNDRGFHGNITIAEDATFVNSTTESFDCNADSSHPIVVDVYGTLSMGSTRWTLGNYNTIKLHEDATITGTGDNSGNNGAFDIENNVTTARIVAEGNATIPANIRIRSKMLVEVSNGKNLTFSGSLIKLGDGSIMEVVSGQVTTTTLPGFKVKIDEGTTFTLKNASWTETANIFSGNGTLELYANTSDFSQYASTSSFAGKLKVIGNNLKTPYFNGTAPQFTAKPDFELDGNMTLTDRFCGSDKKFTVKNLTCTTSGRIDPYYTNTADARYVSTLQTRDTVCAAVFVSNDSATERKTGLYVYGQDATVHSLTLTGANTTRGPLEVDTYGKVVFSSTGYWYGPVTIGENGYLQSDSTAATVAGTLTLQDGATVVRSSQPVKATTLTALDSAATIKIAFADGVTPADGMVVLSGTWATQPDAARFSGAPAGYEFAVTSDSLKLVVIKRTVTVDGTTIDVPETRLSTALMTSYTTYSSVLGNSAASAFLTKYYDSTTQTIDSSYLTDNGLNGMPRAVSYLLGLENPDDATTAFVMESASVSSGEGNTPVLTFTGKSYSTDRATVTYSLYGGDSPNNMSEVTPDSNSGNVITVTVPSNATVKYYQLKMTVTPK